MGTLVSVGNLTVDLVMRIPALPEAGGDVMASASETWVGGGLNTMVAARRDGMRVAYAGHHGTGRYGDLSRQALRDNDIEAVQPPYAGLDTGHCFALVDDTGERTFINYIGAEGRLGREDLDRVRPAAGDTLFVSGYSLVHPVNSVALARWLPGIDPRIGVALDVGPLVDTVDPAVLNPVLDRADVLTANRREALLMVPGAELSDIAAILARRHRLATVIRDGANGCWVATAESPPVRVPGFDVSALDTNGAGDTHDGVLLAALDDGLDLESAARRANAAAAIAVTRSGPATAPTTAEIDEFLATS